MRVCVCVHLKANPKYIQRLTWLCVLGTYKYILYINYGTVACCRYVLGSRTIYIDFE